MIDDLTTNDAFPAILEIQNSIAVAALATNRTRVASLMWGRSFSLIRHRWAGVEEEHHTLSHNSTAADLMGATSIEQVGDRGTAGDIGALYA